MTVAAIDRPNPIQVVERRIAGQVNALRPTRGVRRAIRALRSECQVWWRHTRAVRRAARSGHHLDLRLHLGCGACHKPGWVNIDLYHPNADLQLDLREPWPFANGSSVYIYSEHVFEHFGIDREVPHVLHEAFRILRPGGVFDVGVPDTEWCIHAYGRPDDEYWRLRGTWHPAWCDTHLDSINYHFRQDGEHLWAWDEESLRRTLTKAGFVDVERRTFDSALDSERRRHGTLYMRARKPTR